MLNQLRSVRRTLKLSRTLLAEPLYRSSYFVILTSVTSAAISFFFWLAAARLSTEYEVGIATSLFSAMSLLILFSRFGFEQSVVRYFPETDKGRVLGTAVWISTFGIVCLGIVLVLGANLFSADFTILKRYEFASIFLASLAAGSITNIIGIAFLASRRPQYYFAQSLVTDVRVLLLFPFVGYGAIGIFGSIGVSLALASIVSLLLVIRMGMRLFKIDAGFLRESLRFSAGNFVIGLLVAAPGYLLPILLLNQVGPSGTAKYFVAYAVASLLFFVPSAFSLSLFVEGSHGRSIKENTTRVIKITAYLLIPAIVLILLTGDRILQLFGDTYTDASDVLRILAVSSVFVGVVSIFYSVKRIQKDIRVLIYLSAMVFVVVMGLSLVLVPVYGIVGAAYAWLAGYGLSAFTILLLAWRENWFMSSSS